MTPHARSLCVVLTALVLAGCAADPKRTGGVRIVTKSEHAGSLPRHSAVKLAVALLPDKAVVASPKKQEKIDAVPVEQMPAVVAVAPVEPPTVVASPEGPAADTLPEEALQPPRAVRVEPPSERSELAKIESASEIAPLPREMPARLTNIRHRFAAAEATGTTQPVKPVAVKNPWIGQKTPTDCGRAALATVATTQGVNAEAAYARVTNPKDAARGYSLSEMLEQSARLGVSMRLMAPPGVRTTGECLEGEKRQAYFKQLSELANAGSPLVVPIATERANHYLVLLSSRDDIFTIRDPAREDNTSISVDELTKLMCPLGYIVMVATPPRGKPMPKLAMSRPS